MVHGNIGHDSKGMALYHYILGNVGHEFQDKELSRASENFFRLQRKV